MSQKKRLVIVVPCYNESASVLPFYEDAKRTLDKLPVEWALLFVNDGSTDQTLDMILSLRAKDPRVRVASLSRNFGYHAALVAGLKNADADVYAIIDVDGEDPPELLESFYQEIERGAQTVYGIRSKRPERASIVFFRWLFYRINSLIADGPIRLWMAEFSMFTRPVRDYILDNCTTFPFLRAELAYVGLRMVGVPYERKARLRGATHYNFFRMAQFAIGGFLASSTFPLRAALYLAALFAAVYVLLVAALGLSLLQAGALSCVMSFAYLLLTLPVLALYLARTYKNVTARPVFFLDPDRSLLS